jgi:hypothetical protein
MVWALPINVSKAKKMSSISFFIASKRNSVPLGYTIVKPSLKGEGLGGGI